MNKKGFIEIEWNYAPAVIILWAAVLIPTWYVDYSLFNKIVISVISLPMTYFIVSAVANR